jgi:hypothetical protein
MKTLSFAALVTGLIFVPMVLRKWNREKPALQTNQNARYDIDEFISDQEL